MKKVIIIFILVIFVMSIAVVNIFGKPIELSETNVYIKTIEIKELSIGVGDDNIKITEPYRYDNGIPVYAIDFQEPEIEGDYEIKSEYTDEEINNKLLFNPNNIFIKLGYTTTSLNPDVEPDNPNLDIVPNQVIESDLSETLGSNVIVGKQYYLFANESILDNSNTIVFYKKGMVTITFSGADGFNASLTIKLWVK